MILDVFVYLAVFAVCIINASAYQKVIRGTRIGGIPIDNERMKMLYCLLGCVFLFPVIAMYGLRYGIGADYFSYEKIFEALHTRSIGEYWIRHLKAGDFFYVEPAYYLLNRFLPSYRVLLWGMGALQFSLFLFAVRNYSRRISLSFALFIFLSTQFIYSLNQTRFAIALCFLLLGYHALAYDKTRKFVFFVLVSALFHKSALFCLLLVFLKEYNNEQINHTRNKVLFVSIILFPILSQCLLLIARRLPVFDRYFSVAKYMAGEMADENWKWLMHVIPVLLPLLIFCKREIFDQKDTRTYFRICIMEVPFRMLGLLNTRYTRFARIGQIAQVIFIPLILSKITDKRKKRMLYTYYIVWYVFYTIYYAITYEEGAILPYVWAFSL